jgi:hypothetical protein
MWRVVVMVVEGMKNDGKIGEALRLARQRERA